MARFKEKISAINAISKLDGSKWINRCYLNKALSVKFERYEAFASHIGGEARLTEVTDLKSIQPEIKERQAYYFTGKSNFDFLVHEVIDYWFKYDRKTRKYIKEGYIILYMNYPNKP